MTTLRLTVRLAAGVGVLVAVVLAIAYWPDIATWLQHFFGFANGSGNGSHYLAWSGIVGDLGLFATAAAVSVHSVLSYRGKNCHTGGHRILPWRGGCWRLGKYDVPGTAYRTCARCSPVVPDDGPTREHIHRMHRQAKSGSDGTTEPGSPAA